MNRLLHTLQIYTIHNAVLILSLSEHRTDSKLNCSGATRVVKSRRDRASNEYLQNSKTYEIQNKFLYGSRCKFYQTVLSAESFGHIFYQMDTRQPVVLTVMQFDNSSNFNSYALFKHVNFTSSQFFQDHHDLTNFTSMCIDGACVLMVTGTLW